MLKYILGVISAIMLMALISVAANKVLGVNKTDRLYQSLSKAAPAVPDITEVFSFRCLQYYQFSEQWHISSVLKDYAKCGLHMKNITSRLAPSGGY